MRVSSFLFRFVCLYSGLESCDVTGDIEPRNRDLASSVYRTVSLLPPGYLPDMWDALVVSRLRELCYR